MTDTDKIVAAILASGYAAAKSSGDAGVEYFVETYHRALKELTKREKEGSSSLAIEFEANAARLASV